MEPEVHVVEKWLQECLQYFTMTNILAKGRKEIDILALDPSGEDRIHVEVRCATSFYLRPKQTKTSNGRSHRNGVDYFQEKKFEHENVKAKIREIWGDMPYRKMLVVFGLHIDASIAAKEAEIELKTINEVINELLLVVKKKPGQRDDILRMIELFYLGQKDRITEREIIEFKRGNTEN